ncbi:hypothetical protein ACKI18_01390 [Streptomyces niveiscabiei]|uniref:Cupin 2 conserved barrel domain-containing protein n=1 Tax=Streptomyces niveiscabiei TaxID=164115 RepID=A0ABW9HH40_9ACTN
MILSQEKALIEGADRGLLCSRDPGPLAVRAALRDLIPADFPGVTRWFLPIAPKMPMAGAGRFVAYTTSLAPGATVSAAGPVRSAYALKVVLSGSVSCEGRRLTAGDWLWIPEGRACSFTAETLGAAVFTILPCVAPPPGAPASSTALGLRTDGDFVTSRDPGADSAVPGLEHFADVTERGAGISHRLLPFAPAMPDIPGGDGRFFVWLSLLEPNARIPRHAHELEQIADYKVVINGSLTAKDRELTCGDWLWAPAPGSYEFSAGETGALLLAGWPYN